MDRDYEIPRDVLAAGEERVMFFIWLVEEKGNDPTSPLTELLALQKFPAIMTDSVALSGMPTISEMYDKNPEMTARLCKLAMQKGYKPKPTDRYVPSLAASEGDPSSFLNHDQGMGWAKSVLNKRGYDVQRGDDGFLFNVRVREPDSDLHEKPIHRLNPKIVERIRKRLVQQNPDLAKADQTKLKNEIVEKHGAP